MRHAWRPDVQRGPMYLDHSLESPCLRDQAYVFVGGKVHMHAPAAGGEGGRMRRRGVWWGGVPPLSG